ncbi:3-deoxy-D-manno-octulosonic acid transferase [Myroides guanonis]|uniref:3-deoxy-D-manno-octulosonic acid transferase n=1 Tax=Myroides guanonis TaxID=1150112 RepID=A0A1I3NQC3_9FLAO|nr:glycosyltransferase N-terminal domain-containing protein [Myroides guanonis]SFJ11382.1 3-deoxy-D-manno-octulosonic-acid transferase [Myroides guanonis]
MFFIYNLLIKFATTFLSFIAFFNPKMKLFVDGRNQWWKKIEEHIQPTDRVFWIHAASLGEYEQGLPLIEELKKRFPNYKIVLTFFSPSGYEVKKNSTIADIVLYLPMDTKSNVKRFLNLVHPEKVFFIKYEYWPNYLNALKTRKIETYLVSGIFRPNQVFFKWYGGFYRKALYAFTHFFVQNEKSELLLQRLKHTNITIVGDTRFDRVSQILENDNKLEFLDEFTSSKTIPTIVIGSSWPEDHLLLTEYINNTSKKTKFIIAPHNIKETEITDLVSKLKVPNILYSERSDKNIEDYKVFIIDTYSLLTKAYSYADIAYIGGGFGTGIHNILEAATFGVPVIIGPNYKKFQEAKDLISLKGCFVVHDAEEMKFQFDYFLDNKADRIKTASINSSFILKNKNATDKIINHIFK